MRDKTLRHEMIRLQPSWHRQLRLYLGLSMLGVAFSFRPGIAARLSVDTVLPTPGSVEEGLSLESIVDADAAESGLDLAPGIEEPMLNHLARSTDERIDLEALHARLSHETNQRFGAILFVDADALPNGDGTSWSTAYRNLQTALTQAAGGGVAQIWVAEGTYFPHSGNDRDASFSIPPEVAVYGGFAGGESSLEERDPAANPTILSGDLQENDTPNFGNRGDNSRQVVTAMEPEGALLDGFIVERGNGDFDGDLLIGGGGMFVLSTGGTPHLIHVVGCIFRNNSTGQTFQEVGNFGGGLLVRGTDANISSCRFEDNRANAGGGLGLVDMDANGDGIDMSVLVADCVFARNDVPTQGGGALFTTMGNPLTGATEGVLVVSRCRIEDNHAGYWGAWIDQNTTFFTIDDCEFIRNRSDVTGGAFGGLHTVGMDVSPIELERCVFHENQTDGGGGGVWLGAADAIMRHCVFLGNEAAAGGGIFSSGYFQEGGAQDVIVENCLLQGNTASDAGAIRSGFNPILRIVNTTIANNIATAGVAGGVFTRAGFVDIDNAILHGNRGVSGVSQTTQFQTLDAGTISINFSLIQGWNGTLGGTGNFSADPLFTDPLGGDGIAGTGDEDLRIEGGSPCIDAGSNSALPAGLVLDLGGEPRRVDDPSTPDTGEGTPPLVDIGAYEFQGSSTDVADGEVLGGPRALELSAWPNPSRGFMHFEFRLAEAANVRVTVFDAAGRVIAIPLSMRLSPGSHGASWNAQALNGDRISNGVYLAVIEDGISSAAVKFTIQR